MASELLSSNLSQKGTEKIVDTVIPCVEQIIPLRGHMYDARSDSSYKGNFLVKHGQQQECFTCQQSVQNKVM